MSKTSSKRRKIFVVALLGLLLIVVLVALRWYVAERRAKSLGDAAIASRDPRVTAANPIGSAGAQNDPTKAATANAVMASASLDAEFARELPSRDAPLANVRAELQALSNRGNYMASCRLAIEVLNCDYFADSGHKKTAQLQARLDAQQVASEERQRLSEEIVQSRLEAERQNARCAGYVRGTIERPWQLLLKAGLQGHLTSAELFWGAYWRTPEELSRPLEAVELIDGAAAFRQYAPQLLAHALSRGHPGATYAMVEQHTGRGTLANVPFLSQFELARKDPQRAYMYAYAHDQAQLLREGTPSGMERVMNDLALELTSDQIEQAKVDAESLMRSWDRKPFNRERRRAVRKRFVTRAIFVKRVRGAREERHSVESIV